jgi:hypothetical protein
MVDILLKVLDGELLLEDVGCVGPARKPSHRGEVTAVAAHRFDDKHAPLGALRRLPDSVADLKPITSLRAMPRSIFNPS